MKHKLLLLAICAAIAMAADHLCGYLAQATALPQQLIDIQTPATLLAKLDELRAFHGRKVVLLGDSLVYGGILEEFGDREWRQHNLAQAVEAQCRTRWPGEPVLVLNLGINGALPCDLERLAALVTACRIDCVLLDIHLRPFSPDFASAATQMARPWLQELQVDDARHIRWAPPTTALDVQPQLTRWLVEHSSVFRYRELLQNQLVHSSTAKAIHRWFRPPTVLSENDQQMQALVKLGQLKQRLKQITLDDTNPQLVALERMLTQLARDRQPFVVFYAKENPDLIDSVFERERHEQLYRTLADRIASASSGQGVYLPPLDELHSDHFLDFTHLNVDGYQILARRLVEVLPMSASKGVLARAE